MKTRDEEIVIIGAGLSGLTVARKLKELGKSCLLLEKSRGLGGRIATRRIDDGAFDHGATFLNYSQYFESFLHLTPDIVLRSSQGFYIEGGMNRMAKILAQDLEVLKNQRAQEIKPEGKRWKVKTEEGLEITTDKLVITAPLPQAILLLEENRLQIPAKLKAIQYKKALVYLAIFKNLPDDLESFSQDDHLIYLMRERHLHPRGVVMHLSDDLAEESFEKSDEEILKLMQNVLKKTILSKFEIEKAELKKWRYSEPHTTLPEDHIEILPSLFLTGDAFSGALRSTNNLVQVLRS